MHFKSDFGKFDKKKVIDLDKLEDTDDDHDSDGYDYKSTEEGTLEFHPKEET